MFPELPLGLESKIGSRTIFPGQSLTVGVSLLNLSDGPRVCVFLPGVKGLDNRHVVLNGKKLSTFDGLSSREIAQ
jgi:hypothetical protein